MSRLYCFDKDGKLTGTAEARKCQITGIDLIPAWATDLEPLEEKVGYEVILTTDVEGQGDSRKFNCEWVYKKILTDEEKKLAGELDLEEGEKVEDGTLITIESPSELYSWDYENFLWFFDEDKRQAKINSINQEAYKEIIAVYPEWKQSNIIRNKEASTEALTAYEEMTIFIDSIRAASDEEINNLPIGAE